MVVQICITIFVDSLNKHHCHASQLTEFRSWCLYVIIYARILIMFVRRTFTLANAVCCIDSRPLIEDQLFEQDMQHLLIRESFAMAVAEIPFG